MIGNKNIHEWKDKIVTELLDVSYILNLAFLIDITTFLNDLNVKLQGKGKLLLNMYTICMLNNFK